MHPLLFFWLPFWNLHFQFGFLTLLRASRLSLTRYARVRSRYAKVCIIRHHVIQMVMSDNIAISAYNEKISPLMRTFKDNFFFLPKIIIVRNCFKIKLGKTNEWIFLNMKYKIHSLIYLVNQWIKQWTDYES